jgi:hypothetical protein
VTSSGQISTSLIRYPPCLQKSPRTAAAYFMKPNNRNVRIGHWTDQDPAQSTGRDADAVDEPGLLSGMTETVSGSSVATVCIGFDGRDRPRL